MAEVITSSTTANLVLPVSIVSQVDVGRLAREIAALDDFMKQAAIRTPGSPLKLPRTSKLLDDVISANQLNVLHTEDRTRLQTFLIELRSQAPVLHLSFSADPSVLFTQKLVTWVRQELHPWALIQFGLQPNIGAGCVLRTRNKQFDFSLRESFRQHRPLLLEKIQANIAASAPQPSQPAPAAQPGVSA